MEGHNMATPPKVILEVMNSTI